MQTPNRITTQNQFKSFFSVSISIAFIQRLFIMHLNVLRNYNNIFRLNPSFAFRKSLWTFVTPNPIYNCLLILYTNINELEKTDNKEVNDIDNKIYTKAME